MIKEFWPGVSLAEYNKWYPLTGKISVTPKKYIKTWPKVDEWFKTFALRAQNDINSYLNFALDAFDINTISDKRIIETLVDMVFVCIEHWVYNRTPIEFNSNASLTLNNGQTQFNSFAMPTINIWDLHPSRMKIWANLTGLKSLWNTAQEGLINPSLIDLNQYYSKMQTDMLLDKKANKSEIPDVSMLETKDDHNKDIIALQTTINTKANKTELALKSDKKYVDSELSKKVNKQPLEQLATIYNDNYQLKGTVPLFNESKSLNDKFDEKANINDLNKKQDKLQNISNERNPQGTSFLKMDELPFEKEEWNKVSDHVLVPKAFIKELKTFIAPFHILSDLNNNTLINSNYAEPLIVRNGFTNKPILWINAWGDETSLTNEQKDKLNKLANSFGLPQVPTDNNIIIYSYDGITPLWKINYKDGTSVLNDKNLNTKAKEIINAINEINSRVPEPNSFYTKIETNALLDTKANKENWSSVGQSEGNKIINYNFKRKNYQATLQLGTINIPAETSGPYIKIRFFFSTMKEGAKFKIYETEVFYNSKTHNLKFYLEKSKIYCESNTEYGGISKLEEL